MILCHIGSGNVAVLKSESANSAAIESVGMIDTDPGPKKMCLHSWTFTQVSTVLDNFLFFLKNYLLLLSFNINNILKLM